MLTMDKNGQNRYFSPNLAGLADFPIFDLPKCVWKTCLKRAERIQKHLPYKRPP